jgi:hypothetical protein
MVTICTMNNKMTDLCSCKLVETSKHFLLKCSLYERLRNDLFVNLSSHLNINNLLFSDSNLPDCENESNFLVIQDVMTPLSTICQLYRGGQSYWWRTPEYQEKTTDLPLVADKL